MPNLYAHLAEIKRHLRIEDTQDDDVLIRIVGAVSRQVDIYCGRHFYVETRTRRYTANGCLGVRVDDLLALTTLATDNDRDGTYETTWSATDYELAPFNAPLESPPAPYSRILRAINGTLSFPECRNGCEATGSWGYYQVLERSSATAGAIGTTSGTTFTASDGTQISEGMTLLIDAEQLYVTAVSANTVTVQRGVNGTTAATHGAASPIDVYTYPLITEAVLYQAALNHLAGAVASPTVGSGEFGQSIQGAGLHPFTRNMLDPLRKVEYS